MIDPIVNRVAQSRLVTINLEDFYPLGERVLFDIKDWLHEGAVLKEKDFREKVKNHDWSQYKDSFVALTCSSDAIIPSWAFLLITTKLAPYTKRVVVGDLEEIETTLFSEIINNLDVSIYKDKLLLIKGCSENKIPQTAYVQLVEKLIPVASTIMYGEACSNVPLYKSAKK
jgi:WD40 repeat protein